MSITTTIATLQAKNALITGVTTAPTKFPASINTADLPLVLVLPGEGSWGTQAIGLKRQDRIYRILVYVEAVGQATIDERMNDVIPLLQAFGAAYLSDISFLSDSNIDQVQIPFTDGGAVVLPYAGNDYTGFEMRVTITEKSTL